MPWVNKEDNNANEWHEQQNSKKEARKPQNMVVHKQEWEEEEVYMLVVVLNEAWRALDMPAPVLTARWREMFFGCKIIFE